MSVYNSPGLMTSGRTVQEGGHDVVYDILGTEESFKKTYLLDFYVGANNDQIITIPYPAFAILPNKAGDVSPAIVVELTEALSNGQVNTIELTYRATPADFEAADEGWRIEEIDQDAMAKAHYLWNQPKMDWSFNGTIVKKIRVKDRSADVLNKLTLKISYRAFYKDAIDTDQFRSEQGPEYSRELGQYILDTLESLKTATDVQLKNLFGNTSHVEDILAEDLTGKAKENWIANELHVVDTTQGKTMIAPAQGSFYPGTDVDGTTLKLFLYHIEQGKIDKDVIASGSKLGWLFIYTLNNLTVFTIATDATFLSHARYYHTNEAGEYVQLAAGTDYQPGDSIDDHRAATHKEVYILKRVPFDPKNQLDGLINDSSAVITTSQSVILTEDNIEKYENYSGTFVLLDPSDSRTRELVLGTDYEFADVNQAKTERTYTRQPVYDHIRLLDPIVTDASHRIGISYQAFGGQVMAKDVRNIRQDLTNLLEVVASSNLLTFKGLTHHPIIKQLAHRLARMESYHHHFNRVDHIIPIRMVNIVSSGTGSGVHTTTTVVDETDFQWFNIAQLYGTRWMNGTNSRKDIGHFRISSREQGWTYEFIVTVDLSAKGSNRMVIKTLGGTGVQFPGVDDFEALTKKELVGLRLVWNGDGLSSGALLQVGINYSKYNYNPTDEELLLIGDTRDTDTITVTNKSGDTSSWELYYNPQETSYEAKTYVGVYGRPKYTQVINEKSHTYINYYTPIDDYNYYVTPYELIRDGVEYFIFNETEHKYELIETLVVGTEVSSYDFPIYERSFYRRRWVRDTHGEGETIHAENNVYVIDGAISCDSARCTLPDKMTIWGEDLADSVSVVRLLERDDGGTVVWVGSAPLAYFSLGPNDKTETLQLHLSLSKLFQRYLDLDGVTALDFIFHDRRYNRYFASRVAVCRDDLDPSSSVRGEGIFFVEDLCALQVRLGHMRVKLDPGDIFVSGGTYFVEDKQGVISEYDIEAEGMIGHAVPAYELTNDSKFVAEKEYYKKVGANYVLLIAGTNYNIGADIGEFEESVYETARNFYVEDQLLVAEIDPALGTSSYINERFDLRQVRLHM